MGNDPDIAHSRTSQSLYNHTPQSLDYPTCAECLHMPKSFVHNYNYTGRKYKNQFNNHQHEIMMKDSYKHNQDKMIPDEIRKLKVKTFPYLNSDDITSKNWI